MNDRTLTKRQLEDIKQLEIRVDVPAINPDALNELYNSESQYRVGSTALDDYKNYLSELI